MNRDKSLTYIVTFQFVYTSSFIEMTFVDLSYTLMTFNSSLFKSLHFNMFKEEAKSTTDSLFLWWRRKRSHFQRWSDYCYDFDPNSLSVFYTSFANSHMRYDNIYIYIYIYIYRHFSHIELQGCPRDAVLSRLSANVSSLQHHIVTLLTPVIFSSPCHAVVLLRHTDVPIPSPPQVYDLRLLWSSEPYVDEPWSAGRSAPSHDVEGLGMNPTLDTSFT